MINLRRLVMAGKLKKIRNRTEICIVCFENEATYTCIPCTHNVLCDICVKEYTNHKFDTCPICRVSLINFSKKK